MSLFNTKKVNQEYQVKLRRKLWWIFSTRKNFGLSDKTPGCLDMESIKKWSKGNPIYVQIWYDQSGNGNQMFQKKNLLTKLGKK